MELRDLRVALHRHWPVALLAFAACVVIGAAGAYLPTKTFRASAVVVATPDPDASGNPVQNANFQMPAILAMAESADFRQAVREELPDDLRRKPVKITATSDPGSGIVRIAAEGGSPRAVAAWANGLAGELLEQKPGSEFLTLSLLEPARVPRSASSPEALPIMVGAVALGVLASVFAALVAARTTRALDVIDEVRDRLGLPVLGAIPASRVLRRRGNVLPDTLDDSRPELAEAFWSLRTSVDLALRKRDTDAVAVFSLIPGEGKSTVATGLAVSLARGGRGVVLVDADMRHPTLHTKLGEPLRAGLAEATRMSPKVLLSGTDVDGLLLLSAGVPDRHPADLTRVCLERVLDDDGHPADHLMIVDVPSLDGIAETRLALTTVGSAIVVVDAGGTRLTELEDALEELKAARVDILGVVVNRARRAAKRHNRDYYYRRPDEISQKRARSEGPPTTPPEGDGKRGDGESRGHHRSTGDAADAIGPRRKQKADTDTDVPARIDSPGAARGE